MTTKEPLEKYHHLQEQADMFSQFFEEAIRDNNAHALDVLNCIHKYSRLAGAGDEQAREELQTILSVLSEDLVIPVARCFSHLLNFINTVEQHQLVNHSVNATDDDYMHRSFEELLIRLKDKGYTYEEIQPHLENLFIEIVLTAHPTESTRRTIIQKHNGLDECLRLLDNPNISEAEKEEVFQRLRELITLTWLTDEVRSYRPSPEAEATWVMNTIEDSLWKAVPKFIRSLSFSVKKVFGQNLGLSFRPLKISSWTGGDRDGNAYVTHHVTKRVINLGRVRFAKLMLEDIKELSRDLTMRSASKEFCDKYQADYEPYRQVLRELRSKIKATASFFEGLVEVETPANFMTQQQALEYQTRIELYDLSESDDEIDISNTQSRTFLKATENLIMQDSDLLDPLLDIYNSLIQDKQKIIAEGRITDIINKIRVFGVTLFRMDIRQESARHKKAVAELVDYYSYGDYYQWSEEQKCQFLEEQIKSKRPLLSPHWKPSKETAEVLATCKLIAHQPPGVINCYVISMATCASDILEVKLLLKLYDEPNNLMVCPLFETLTDLHNCKDVMRQLFTNDYYKSVMNGKQMVMVGYSDSAKDAGFFAAGWAQYEAQEQLVALAKEFGVKLTLFHGRGGTIGRGGSPAHAALLSQPPGSLSEGLRVTEQGEMIRFKYGLPEVAKISLDLYASAILEGNLLPPAEPKPEWREVMKKLSEVSCEEYRRIVFKDPNFVPYFRQATPEVELGNLNLGSRAAKRNKHGGVETLRAIPWIFAWTQNRLLLPTWLGTGTALEALFADPEQKGRELVVEMMHQWPFFATRVGMLEMVFSKVSTRISAMYEKVLVDPELQYLGNELREKAIATRKVILSLKGDNTEHNLMEDLPWISQSIKKRKSYSLPLHLLQIELLRRSRSGSTDPRIIKALMITITGIAAGMRNTG